MFELLLILAGLIAIGGALIAFDGSRDVFHPLVFVGPMMAFLYCWMPLQLLHHDALVQFFDEDQLRHVQMLNILGVSAFVLGCLGAGVRIRKTRFAQRKLSAPRRAANAGCIGDRGRFGAYLLAHHDSQCGRFAAGVRLVVCGRLG